MAIKWHYYDGYFVDKLSGVVTLDECLGLLEERSQLEEGRQVIEVVDIANSANINLRLEEFRRIANRTSEITQKLSGFHYIILPRNRVHFAIARLFEAIIGNHYPKVKIHVFRDREKAISFIKKLKKEYGIDLLLKEADSVGHYSCSD